MSEYDRTDAGIYDSFSTGLEGDEAFYVEEAARVEDPVLEIGCGTGRIMIPIAEVGRVHRGPGPGAGDAGGGAP